MGGQVNCGFLAAPTVLPDTERSRHRPVPRAAALAAAADIAHDCRVGLPRFRRHLLAKLLAAPRAFLPRSRSAFRSHGCCAIRSAAAAGAGQGRGYRNGGQQPRAGLARVREISDKWEALARKINLKPD